MDSLLHANIFFVITSVATVLFTVIIVIILYQVLQIVKIVRRILIQFEEGGKQLADDMAMIRSYVANGGVFTKLLGFFLSSSAKPKRKTRKRNDE